MLGSDQYKLSVALDTYILLIMCVDMINYINIQLLSLYNVEKRERHLTPSKVR